MEIFGPGMERVIVWQRWAPLPEASREAAALAVQWRVFARERFAAVGAETLVELGGTIAFALELTQLTRAIELCITSVREAERAEPSAGGLTCGVAVGSVDLDLEHGAFVGDAIDRAQAIANAGDPSDVLLDPAAQRATGEVFLFSRELSCGLGLSAAVLDHAFPRRSDCQHSLAHLAQPALTTTPSVQLDSLRKLAKSTGRHRALLVGPHGVGISQWIEDVAREIAPPLWLELRALGASLAPLAGLMYALRRLPAHAAPEQLLARGDEPDRHALATMVAIRAGQAVSRRDAVLALRQYVGRAGEGGKRALISVDPAPLIDPSSVGVVAEAVREGGPNVLAIMRLLLDSKPPEAFSRGGGLSELRVRGLSQHEARALATLVLRTDAPNDIARRAAAMGGSNPLAVAEAVRVLVACGDVVFSDGSFRWRRGPAGRLTTMSVEALFEERVDALAAPLRRALELLANVPDPDEREVVQEIALAGGFVAETWSRAVEELQAFGFLGTSERGIALSAGLRLVVQSTLAPARALELHRTIAEVLEPRIEPSRSYARATLAYYFARAGRVEEAASIFIEVAELACSQGFVRSGVRLAAAAVECTPSEATRQRAAQLVEQINERQQQPKAAGSVQTSEPSVKARQGANGDVTHGARERAVKAILARDFDEVERAFELLVAAGRDGESVDRLRTITLLAKGDHGGAAALLDRLRERESHAHRETPRLALTAALVAIAAGELEPAVRSSLSALARTRQANDSLGERAALGVLAMCYRELGREADAARLRSAALVASA